MKPALGSRILPRATRNNKNTMKKKYEVTPEQAYEIIKKMNAGEKLSECEHIKYKISLAKIEVVSYGLRMKAAKNLIDIAKESKNTVDRAMSVVSDLMAEDINDEALQNAMFAIGDMLKYIKNSEDPDLLFSLMVNEIVRVILGASQLMVELKKQEENRKK